MQALLLYASSTQAFGPTLAPLVCHSCALGRNSIKREMPKLFVKKCEPLWPASDYMSLSCQLQQVTCLLQYCIRLLLFKIKVMPSKAAQGEGRGYQTNRGTDRACCLGEQLHSANFTLTRQDVQRILSCPGPTSTIPRALNNNLQRLNSQHPVSQPPCAKPDIAPGIVPMTSPTEPLKTVVPQLLQ